MPECKLPPVQEHPGVLDAEAAAVSAWNLERLAVEENAPTGQLGQGAIVGVVDTGCDIEHDDLAARVRDARDFTRSRHGYEDRQGHGTHVAGTIAGTHTGGAIGAELLIAKGLGDGGFGDSRDVAAAIDWCVDAGAHIVNLSLGSRQQDNQIIAAAKAAHDAGVLVVAASGNDGAAVSYPAASRYCRAVGATRPDDRLASFSNYGQQVETVAPGWKIPSCRVGGGYCVLSGTSMAAPLVAACAALRVGLEGGPVDWRLIDLPEVCDDLGRAGRDPHFGYGMLSLPRLLAKPGEGGEGGEPDGTEPDLIRRESLYVQGKGWQEVEWRGFLLGDAD